MRWQRTFLVVAFLATPVAMTCGETPLSDIQTSQIRSDLRRALSEDREIVETVKAAQVPVTPDGLRYSFTNGEPRVVWSYETTTSPSLDALSNARAELGKALVAVLVQRETRLTSEDGAKLADSLELAPQAPEAAQPDSSPRARLKIAPIKDVRLPTGESTQVPISLDPASPARTDLTFSAKSSDTGMIPSNGLVFTGSPPTRTLSISSFPGDSGVATVTVAISDASGPIDSSTFRVIVEPRRGRFAPGAAGGSPHLETGAILPASNGAWPFTSSPWMGSPIVSGPAGPGTLGDSCESSAVLDGCHPGGCCLFGHGILSCLHHHRGRATVVDAPAVQSINTVAPVISSPSPVEFGPIAPAPVTLPATPVILPMGQSLSSRLPATRPHPSAHDGSARSWESYYREGYEAFWAGNDRVAIEALTAASQMSDDPRAWEYLSLAASRSGDAKMAREAARYAAASLIVRPSFSREANLALSRVQGPMRNQLRKLESEVKDEQTARIVLASRPSPSVRPGKDIKPTPVAAPERDIASTHGQ